MKHTKSKYLFEQSKKYIPGGVNSPVRACQAVGTDPVFIERGSGSHLFDVDGNEYIDYVGSWGPLILGHANEAVISAVKKSVENGLTFGAATEKEYEIAHFITSKVPNIEKIRMVNSGTEAVMSAIRAARGYTKRDYIIKFIGCYHGHSDGLLVKAGSGAITSSVPDSLGVPSGFTQYTLLADYNDTDSVEQLFAEYKDKIAAVVVEPVAANMGVVPPQKGFLAFLRDITAKNHSVLIFDEVITGFRLAFGGAQEYFGVDADLVTYGKIIGGGMPVGAYGGKAEILNCVAPVGKVYQAGTLSGNPVAMTAGITTLKILSENAHLYSEIDTKMSLLERAYHKRFGNSVSINRVGSLMSVFFTNQKVTDYRSAKTSNTETFASYYRYMLKNGIYIAPSQFEAMFMSFAHTENDIEQTRKVIENFDAE